jgi:hypothetical protein
MATNRTQMNQEMAHTNKDGECYIKLINSIVVECDNEYYMSALGPPLGDLERAKRGRSRILNHIQELKKLEQKVACTACRHEIEKQINIQMNGVLEIENIWKLGENS